MRNLRTQVIVAITLILATMLSGCNKPVNVTAQIGDAKIEFSGTMIVSGDLNDLQIGTIADAAGGSSTSSGVDSDGNPYPWIPPTIETDPRPCNGYQRADGFNMDTAVSTTDGKEYDVTIISTLPKNTDGSLNFCDPYRVIQDGSHSSIIQDQLPQPPSTRAGNWERDFTFLGDDWSDVEWAYFAGVACKLLIDDDKNGTTARKQVLDENGAPVQFSHGTQRFHPVVGGWYLAQCGQPAEATGFRIDREPWQR